MNVTPHASWAQAYDIAYEHSFGDFYNFLTDATIQVIAGRTLAGRTIVDFGAGTGRLSVPFAEMGYEVTAIEPCEEMLSQLKAKYQKGKLHCICSKMQDYEGHAKFDIALCVFTVILYLLDEDDLRKAFRAAYNSLKPNGMLLIDIPTKSIFQSYSSKDYQIKRTVSVIEQSKNIFTYTENLQVRNSNGTESTYSDKFYIRYWPPETVSKALMDAGFVYAEDLSGQFLGAGSQYWLMKKPVKIVKNQEVDEINLD